MATYYLDPITRIEGHLCAEVDTAANYATTGIGVVNDVKMKGEMFRGFENILQGRRPPDAIEITQRICGVCPVPHGLTATHAVEEALNIAPNGGEPGGTSSNVPRLVRNLILGAEYLMSHITHFYHLAALSYVQGPGTSPWTPYFDSSYYQPVLTKPTGEGLSLTLQGEERDVPNPSRLSGTDLGSIWDRVIIDYVEALKWRRRALEAGAIFAGRMPLTRTFVAGGVTCSPTTTDVDNYLSILGSLVGSSRSSHDGILGFIRWHYLPLTHIVSYLYGKNKPPGSSLGAVTTNRDYDNDGVTEKKGFGAGNSNYLAYGIFNLNNTGGADPNRLLKRGYVKWTTSAASGAVTPNLIGEYIANSRYTLASGGTEPIAPSGGYTDPNAANGYSWLKSPRLNVGTALSPNWKACQVGPLARMVVHGEANGGLTTSWEDTAKGTYTGDNKITTTEASYRLGTCKPSLILDHHTLSPIIEFPANLAAVATYFGSVPGSNTAKGVVQGFLCGCSTMDRHRARAYEALKIAKACIKWAEELKDEINASNSNYTSWTYPPGTTYGVGMEEAPRGALGHWVTVTDGHIENYQCIVPTTWNANPCHSATRNATTRGPIEECCVGSGDTQVSLSGMKSQGAAVPVEVLRIVQSFDPCIACAVHVIEPEGEDLEGRCLE